MTTMTLTAFDVRKEYRNLYHPPATAVTLMDVPPMNFLMIDGHGDPNTSQEYRDALDTLYAVSYTLKFMLKKGAAAIDYGVLPLEGLWWATDTDAFALARKDTWDWTMMIMQPPFVTGPLVEEAIGQVAAKKNPSALPKLRFACFHEGLSAQIMHIGPFSAEGPTIERLHHFIGESGYAITGKHHEVYLSDPRRVAPERMKTVIRQPIGALPTSIPTRPNAGSI